MPTAECQHYKETFEMTYGAPFFGGNRIEILKNGVEIFPAMLDDIRAARRSIKFLTFVYWTGDIAEKFAQALAERAKAGVDVKVLLDAFGARVMSKDLIALMEGAGVDLRWFRPLSNWRIWAADNRTHRKVLTIDGSVAFTGGVGIAEEWEGDARDETEWRDTHFRITGPAVHGLVASFLDNWTETGQSIADDLGQAQPLAPTGDADIMIVRSTAAIGWSDIATLMQTVVGLARSRLRIATPYFMPDSRTSSMLKSAADKGVAVEILIPGPFVDKRVSELAASDAFDALLSAGIKIWQYQPTMLHTKIITLDGRIACVGSANFNRRSMRKDDEVTLVVDHAETIAALDENFDQDLARSRLLDLGTWRKRGLARRSVEKLASLLKPQV